MSMGASSGGNFGQLSNIGTRWSLGYGSTTTTTGTEVITWNSSGNVGIGTVTPDAALTVKSIESAAKGISIWGRSDNIGTLRFYNSTGATQQGGLQSNSTSFDLLYNDVPRLSIASTGAATFSSSVTANSLSLTTPLAVANGGTGQTTPTAALNALLPTQSQSTTIGATLKSNGTNSYWDNFSAAGTVQDQSGNFYNTVAIGTQVWFKENLRTKKYRSGALIPVKTNTDTSTLVGQIYYYANDSLTNYSIFGALYNWKATQSSDSLCPSGWHVPSDTEWTTLTTYLGGEIVAGGKMKTIGTTYYNSPNVGATNESGFSGFPGGYRSTVGSFFNINNDAFFWSATAYDNNFAWLRALSYLNGNLGRYNDGNKSLGLSVRCLKN
jgi:uncharacterized protein (TIGR02145 family)